MNQHSLKTFALVIAMGLSGAAMAAGGGGGGQGGGAMLRQHDMTQDRTQDRVQDKDQDRTQDRARDRVHAPDKAASGAAANEPVRTRLKDKNAVQNKGADKQLRTKDANRVSTQEGTGSAEPAAPAASK
jgi:hypothetical protein